MATKLYPPNIEGVLPAFYKTYDEDGNVKNAAIAIPFGMNRAVSLEDVYKLELRLKTVSTNSQIYLGECDSFDPTDLVAYFTIDATTAKSINEGQFYKAQLAFVYLDEYSDTTTIGYWSTVGTIKCVAEPKVTIGGFNEMEINTFIQQFVGEYEQNTDFGDSTEKVETYEFNIWDKSNNLILTSGVKLHNSADDVSSSSSIDIYKINHEIQADEMYYVQYTVTTLNNLHLSSPLYKVMQGNSIDIEYPLQLHCNNNFDNGYIELYLQGELDNNGQEEIYTGTFVITRGSDKDNYFEWNEIVKFNMDGGYPSEYVFRDFTVEQGITYKYRLQQFNQYELYSNPVLLTDNNGNEISVTADFEDMFIYDGKRQLRVRFNPKVNSFKNTIPEQKIETIGSKYPFIFRNGHVNYKEFPVSGLISFTMDDAMLFLTQQELEEAKILEPNHSRRSSGYIKYSYADGEGFNPHEILHNDQIDNNLAAVVAIQKKLVKNWIKGSENNTNEIYSVRQDTNLTSENMMGERYFKLKVLDWLTDGEVKLFRSPGEGNYLVRILNVSMSPQDTLGRMLHTFTGTCYEIDELTYNNLIHYKIISENVYSLIETHWASVKLDTMMNNIITPWKDFNQLDESGEPIIDPATKKPIAQTYDNWNNYYLIPLNNETIIGFEAADCAPGDMFWITYAGSDDDAYVVIGETGYYNYTSDDRLIERIAFLPNPRYSQVNEYARSFNYYYSGIQHRKFDTVRNIFSKTQIAKQYIGPYDNVFEPYSLYTGTGLEKKEIFSVENINLDTQSYVNNSEFQDVVNNIKRHPNIIINSNGNVNTVKFDALQVEVLHAQKRELIPVYALGRWNEDELPECALTPFGIGYVNYHSIVEDNDWIRIATPENVLDYIERTGQFAVNTYDLEKIDLDLQTSEPTNINAYSILEIFVPEINDNELSWVFSGKYWDTYTKDWLKGEGYDPSFSITLPDTSERIVTIKEHNSDEIISHYLTNLKKNFNSIMPGDEDYLDLPLNGTQIYDSYGELDNNYLNSTNDINLNEINEITFTKLGKLDYLRIGNGVMIELTFQLQIVDYSIEENNALLRSLKQDYQTLKQQYLNNLSNYYGIQTSTTEEDIQANIAVIKQKLLALAENIDTTMIDENGELQVNMQDGIPVIANDPKANYYKIINSTNEAMSNAVAPRPLKIQLIMAENKGIEELLYGWTSEEMIYEPIDDRTLNDNYYILINGQYEKINPNDVPLTTQLYIGKYKTYKGLTQLPHFDFNNEYSSNDINWYDCDPINTNQFGLNQKIINENKWPVLRWVPYNYAIDSNFSEVLNYGNQKNSTEIIGEENSYDIFGKADLGLMNTLEALKLKIDKNQFKSFNYQILNSPPINKNERVNEENKVISCNFIYNTSNGESIEFDIADYISLSEFIEINKYLYNQIGELDDTNSLSDTINEFKDNNQALLYLIAHTPWAENNVVKLIKDKVNADKIIYQKDINIDYNLNNQDILELSKIIDINVLTSLINSKILTYINNDNPNFYNENINEKDNYVITIFDNKIFINEDYKNEIIAACKEEMNNYLYGHTFWNNRVGCLVEVKDDSYISLIELIKNYYIEAIILEQAENLLNTRKDTILSNQIKPNSEEYYTITEYNNYLQDLIATTENAVQVWTTILEETTNLLQTETDQEKINELQKLQDTARYSKQISEVELENYINMYSNFKVQDSNYSSWFTIDEKQELVLAQQNQIQEIGEPLKRDYQDKIDIYIYLYTLMLDLLYKKDTEIFSINNKNYQSVSVSTIENILQEYLNHANLLYTLPESYKFSNKLNVKFGYQYLLNFAFDDAEFSPGWKTDESSLYNQHLNKLKEYEEAKNALLNRYQALENEINTIIGIYQGRAVFIETLQVIIDRYENAIDEGKSEIRKLISDLLKAESNLNDISVDNEPSEKNKQEIWNALTTYLLYLQHYYIEEVERRYDV